MDPKIITLCAVIVAIGAGIASQYVPPELSTALIGAATGLLGWVGFRRPVDISTTTHPDDAR